MFIVKRKILYFLCTGNAGRSQMAEGFAKEYLGFEGWDIRAAGIERRGLNPLATKVMTEVGIDISNQQSNFVDTNLMDNAQFVITLSDDARARLPKIPDAVKSQHWSFEDPAAVQGTEEEKLAAFRRVRDQIDTRIKEFVEMQEELGN